MVSEDSEYDRLYNAICSIVAILKDEGIDKFTIKTLPWRAGIVLIGTFDIVLALEEVKILVDETAVRNDIVIHHRLRCSAWL